MINILNVERNIIMFGKYHRFDCNYVKTLLVINLHLSKNKGKDISQLKYSQIIESLIYLIVQYLI